MSRAAHGFRPHLLHAGARHIVPVLIVAKHLVEHGHDVRVFTGIQSARKVRASGAEFLALPADAHIDLDLDNTDVNQPQRAPTKPIRPRRCSVIAFFVKPIRRQIRAVDAAIGERPVDIILTEMMFMGAAILRRRGPVGRLRNAVLTIVARRIFAPVYDDRGPTCPSRNGGVTSTATDPSSTSTKARSRIAMSPSSSPPRCRHSRIKTSSSSHRPGPTGGESWHTAGEREGGGIPARTIGYARSSPCS